MDDNEARLFEPCLARALRGTRIVRCGCGDDFTVLLSSLGALLSFGRGGDGCLGLGDTVDRDVPCEISGLPGSVSDFACGRSHVLAVTRRAGGGARVHAWGCATHARLGLGPKTGSCSLPVEIQSLAASDIVDVSAGMFHSAAVGRDGAVYCWGRASEGQTGLLPVRDTVVAPMRLPMFPGKPRHERRDHGEASLDDDGLNGPKAVQIVCGDVHTMCRCRDSTVYAWGGCRAGARRGVQQSRTPRIVAELKGRQVISIVAGSEKSFALIKPAS